MCNAWLCFFLYGDRWTTLDCMSDFVCLMVYFEQAAADFIYSDFIYSVVMGGVCVD